MPDFLRKRLLLFWGALSAYPPPHAPTPGMLRPAPQGLPGLTLKVGACCVDTERKSSPLERMQSPDLLFVRKIHLEDFIIPVEDLVALADLCDCILISTIMWFHDLS